MAGGKREGRSGERALSEAVPLQQHFGWGDGGWQCTCLRARTLPAAEAASMPSGSSRALIAAMMAAMVACYVLRKRGVFMERLASARDNEIGLRSEPIREIRCAMESSY